jgi:hypothetical protein
MAFEQRDNEGSLFKNANKESGDKRPDHKGSCMVGGTKWDFAGWWAREKDGTLKKDKNGNPWLNFKFSPPYNAEQQERAPAPARPRADLDDEIPF